MEVILSWKKDDVVTKYKCHLLKYDEVFITADGKPIPEEVVDGWKKDGLVLFADPCGVFSINATDIVYVQAVERDQDGNTQ